jgi:hypothetical protein
MPDPATQSEGASPPVWTPIPEDRSGDIDAIICLIIVDAVGACFSLVTQIRAWTGAIDML